MRMCGHRPGGGSIGGAIFVVLLGLIFLATTAIPGLSFGDVISRGWPFILIVTGVISLTGNIVRAPFRGRLDIGGPIILITLGGLFALQTFAHIGFNRTWPVLLVVIGTGLVFKRLFALPFLPFMRRRL